MSENNMSDFDESDEENSLVEIDCIGWLDNIDKNFSRAAEAIERIEDFFRYSGGGFCSKCEEHNLNGSCVSCCDFQFKSEIFEWDCNSKALEDRLICTRCKDYYLCGSCSMCSKYQSLHEKAKNKFNRY